MPPIPPDVRHRIAGLRLRTRRAVGGDGLGLQASRSRGAGLEFAQYRAYEPGDEPRQIDWKLYARSDKFFVREAERESPVALWILLDASGSMADRWDAGRLLCLCLAELALAGGDRFGWIVLAEEGVRLAGAEAGAAQRDRLRRELAGLSADGGFPDAARLAPVYERVGARDLLVMLSDWFDPAPAALAARLAAAGREVLAIELLTRDERDFAFAGGHRFRDPETGAELLADSATVRAGFLDRLARHRAALAAGWDASGVRHAALVTDQPIDAPLHALFGASFGAGA